MNNSTLKPHHHIKISSENKLDLMVWREMLMNPDGYYKPFMETKALNAVEIDMYSDASGNYSLGFGAYCGTEWSFGQWDYEFCHKVKPSIEYLELFGVLVGVLNWIKQFGNKRIILFFDNESVVYMINNNSSNCKNCMVLLRMLVAESMFRNVRIFARHVGTKQNGKADALSRLDFKRFWALANGQMNSRNTPVPKEIWPMNKIWKDI